MWWPKGLRITDQKSSLTNMHSVKSTHDALPHIYKCEQWFVFAEGIHCLDLVPVCEGLQRHECE